MKKKITSILILCMCTTILPGCAMLKPTPEKILKRTSNVLAKTESFSGEAEMNMDISTKVENASFTMGLNLEGDIDYSVVNSIAYMDGSMNMEVLGVSQDIEFENYITPDATYTFMEDTWNKTEQKNNFDNLGINVDLLKDSLILNEDLVKEKGKECYEFIGEVPFEDIMETIQTLNDFDDLLDNMKDDDKVEYSLLINKKTFEPVKQTVKFEFEVEGVESQIDYSLTFEEFNKELDLELPKEAKKAKTSDSSSFEDMFESDDQDIDEFDILDNKIEFNGKDNESIEETFYETDDVITDKNIIFKDYDKKEYANLNISEPYYFDDIQDWGCEVYVKDNEWSIAFVNGYDDSLEDSIDYRQEYIDESNYDNLVNKEEKVSSKGVKYTLFTVEDTSGDLTYYAIVGNKSYSVELNISDYFVREVGLEIDTTIDDLVNSVIMY